MGARLRDSTANVKNVENFDDFLTKFHKSQRCAEEFNCVSLWYFFLLFDDKHCIKSELQHEQFRHEC